MPAERSKKKPTGQSDNDIYTALMGLTVLVLTATTVWVCLRSLNMFDKIFSLSL